MSRAFHWEPRGKKPRRLKSELIGCVTAILILGIPAAYFSWPKMRPDYRYMSSVKEAFKTHLPEFETAIFADPNLFVEVRPGDRVIDRRMAVFEVDYSFGGPDRRLMVPGLSHFDVPEALRADNPVDVESIVVLTIAREVSSMPKVGSGTTWLYGGFKVYNRRSNTHYGGRILGVEKSEIGTFLSNMVKK